MGGWGNEESFSDYTVLYDVRMGQDKHGVCKENKVRKIAMSDWEQIIER